MIRRDDLYLIGPPLVIAMAALTLAVATSHIVDAAAVLVVTALLVTGTSLAAAASVKLLNRKTIPTLGHMQRRREQQAITIDASRLKPQPSPGLSLRGDSGRVALRNLALVAAGAISIDDLKDDRYSRSADGTLVVLVDDESIPKIG